MIADIYHIILGNIQAVRVAHLSPLLQELPLSIKNLDAFVGAVCHKEAPA